MTFPLVGRSSTVCLTFLGFVLCLLPLPLGDCCAQGLWQGYNLWIMRRLLVSLVATLMCVAVPPVVIPVQAQMRGRAGFGRSVVVGPGFRGGFSGGVAFGHGPRVFVGSRGFFRPRIFP